MLSERYSNAIAEVLHYLKGIREEDINKIPTNFITFLKENVSKEYKCEFDYEKPLNELNLMEETKGIIGMICYNYWCETKEQKQSFLDKLNQNEKMYQEELKEKYSYEAMFRKPDKKSELEDIQSENIEINGNTSLIVVKENIIKKICKKIIHFLKKL